jgi:predicted amidophosphoribosyltransferase
VLQVDARRPCARVFLRSRARQLQQPLPVTVAARHERCLQRRFHCSALLCSDAILNSHHVIVSLLGSSDQQMNSRQLIRTVLHEASPDMLYLQQMPLAPNQEFTCALCSVDTLFVPSCPPV